MFEPIEQLSSVFSTGFALVVVTATWVLPIYLFVSFHLIHYTNYKASEAMCQIFEPLIIAIYVGINATVSAVQALHALSTFGAISPLRLSKLVSFLFSLNVLTLERKYIAPFISYFRVVPIVRAIEHIKCYENVIT